LRLAICFLFVSLATGLVRSISVDSLFWVANGVLLAYLLLASRRRWPAYLATGFAAQMVGGALTGVSWRMNLLLTSLNLLEVLIGALLLRKRSTAPPQFTDLGYLLRFVLFGIVAGPLATGLIVAVASRLWPHIPFGATPLEWVASDAFGIGIVTPISVAVSLGAFRRTLRIEKNWIYILLLASVTVTAFSHTSVPLLFVIYPVLVLVLLRMGIGWASVATLFVAGVGGGFTVHGQGPFALSLPVSPLEPSLLLLVYVSSVMFMLYSISVVLERQHSAESRLQEIVALHTLVTENSRDVIILSDLHGHRNYVSSAAETLFGWKPEEMIHQANMELVHPDDLSSIDAHMSAMRYGIGGGILEYRIRKKDGEYVWVEANVRVVCDPATGFPSGHLILLRGISERKRAEQKLKEAYNAVEALAVTDSLTGLANRRRLDQCLATEWRRSMRDRQPLSILMIDVDKFKIYNDTYGHLRGDSCLKQIAEACMDVVSRPGDLVARFGGEEFAVILPNTHNEGAVQVAREVCEAVSSRGLPHSGQSYGIVTISVGCATMIPHFGIHSQDLIQMADLALYQAKHGGRNQVCNGNTQTIADEDESKAKDSTESTADVSVA
jgi:diguanylate cyclase (GGDEF)-like protein/PAS domain S-box-containing protein